MNSVGRYWRGRVFIVTGSIYADTVGGASFDGRRKGNGYGGGQETAAEEFT